MVSVLPINRLFKQAIALSAALPAPELFSPARMSVPAAGGRIRSTRSAGCIEGKPDRLRSAHKKHVSFLNGSMGAFSLDPFLFFALLGDQICFCRIRNSLRMIGITVILTIGTAYEKRKTSPDGHTTDTGPERLEGHEGAAFYISADRLPDKYHVCCTPGVIASSRPDVYYHALAGSLSGNCLLGAQRAGRPECP